MCIDNIFMLAILNRNLQTSEIFSKAFLGRDDDCLYPY